MAITSTNSFLDRLSNLPSKQSIEGAFWSVWFGHSVYRWSTEVQKGREIDVQSLFFETCSAFAGLSAITCWAAEVSLIFIGSAFPYISAGGYWASSLTSSARLWKEMGDFVRQLAQVVALDDNPMATAQKICCQLPNLLKVSFLVCGVAWAILSGFYALSGSAALFWAADAFFYYGVLLFCSHFAIQVIAQRPAS